jgi:5-methylcytosine-specific restriction endonuclease McrA
VSGRQEAERWAVDNKCVGRSPWDVDHVVAMALGGDAYDLGNLRALCKRCHSVKTRVDAGKIAQLRKKEK